MREGQVEPEQLDVEPEDFGVQDPQGLIEQFLPGFVAIADDDPATL